MLEQVLASGGKGLFCDPNRLGLDAIERGFNEKFILAIEEIPLNWPPRKGAGVGKMGFLYQLTRRSQQASWQKPFPRAEKLLMYDDEALKQHVAPKAKVIESKVDGIL